MELVNPMEKYGLGESLVKMVTSNVDKYPEIYNLLRRRRYTVADIEMTYRQVNSLDSSGILEDRRNEKNEWRRFNLVELVYLKIISELRKYGVRNKQIRKVKRFLFDEQVYKLDKLMTDLTYGETAIMGAFAGVRMGCMLFADGRAYFVDPAGFINFNGNFIKEETSYLYLSLNDILKVLHKGTEMYDEIISFPSLSDIIGHTVMSLMNDKEREILEIYRNNDYRKVTIVKKDSGDVNVYGEISEPVGKLREEDLIDLFKTKNYSNIAIQRRDGHVVHFSLEDIYKITNN